MTPKKSKQIVEAAVQRIKKNSDVCIEWELGKIIECQNVLYKEAIKEKGPKRLTGVRLANDILKEKAKLLWEMSSRFSSPQGDSEENDTKIATAKRYLESLDFVTPGQTIDEMVRQVVIEFTKLKSDAELGLQHSQTEDE